MYKAKPCFLGGKKVPCGHVQDETMCWGLKEGPLVHVEDEAMLFWWKKLQARTRRNNAFLMGKNPAGMYKTKPYFSLFLQKSYFFNNMHKSADIYGIINSAYMFFCVWECAQPFRIDWTSAGITIACYLQQLWAVTPEPTPARINRFLE
jgi:hypothetical protein